MLFLLAIFFGVPVLNKIGDAAGTVGHAALWGGGLVLGSAAVAGIMNHVGDRHQDEGTVFVMSSSGPTPQQDIQAKKEVKGKDSQN